jgi:oligopeptide transport system ATP-binding protein
LKGKRIGAGTRSYTDAIKKAKKDLSEKKITKQEYDEIVSKNRALIKDARSDSKQVDRQYAASLVQSLEKEYAEKIRTAHGDSEKVKALKKEFKNRCRVAKKSKLITQIQMIFQDPIASLDPRMTVRDIIAEGLVINGITDKDYINEKVYEILETVGLVREHADRYPHEFSGGQRQRIGIARAVVMQPEMIIADEPISALDVSIQAQVINLLNDLRERLGLTIMFIAHDLSVVKYFSDRIGVMYFGKMVELADSDELFKNPLHPYTKSLLSAIPLPDPIYEKQRTRIHYNPIAEHDYSVDTPSFREITPGHFVYCNDAEEQKYKQMVK